MKLTAAQADLLARVRDQVTGYTCSVDYRPAKKLLDLGITIDAVSASNFRHVLKRVKEITDAALSTQHKEETP